jgi:hypothetical protein
VEIKFRRRQSRQDAAELAARRLLYHCQRDTRVWRGAAGGIATISLWLTLADIASAESSVLDLYRRRLPTIRTAANADG